MIPAASEITAVIPGQVALFFRRNDRAKRYRLVVDRDGRAQVTIPRRGSRKEAERFVAEHRQWLAGQLDKHRLRQETAVWRLGADILVRGQSNRLEGFAEGRAVSVRLGTERIGCFAALPADGDLRPLVEAHLRKLAGRELPLRVGELAARHHSPVKRISVRNQRSRWGSCSRRGQVSLNWRLVQVPAEVRDYIILHELMHLREMNHSPRFWGHVAEVCPAYRQCEIWLRLHSPLLLR